MVYSHKMKDIILVVANRINGVDYDNCTTGTWCQFAKRELTNIKIPTVDDVLLHMGEDGVNHIFIEQFGIDTYKKLCENGSVHEQNVYHKDELNKVSDSNIECKDCIIKKERWAPTISPYLNTFRETLNLVNNAKSDIYGTSTAFSMCAIVVNNIVVSLTTSNASLKSKVVQLRGTEFEVYECDLCDVNPVAWVLHNSDDNRIYTTNKIKRNKKGVERTKKVYHVYLKESRGKYNEETREGSVLKSYSLGKKIDSDKAFYGV